MFLSNHWRRLAIVSITFLLPVELWGAGWLKVRMDSQVQSSVGVITLEKISSASASSSEILSRALSLELGNLNHGEKLKLPKGYLEARIQEAVGEGVTLELLAGEQVEVISKSSAGLSNAEIPPSSSVSKKVNWEALAREKGGIPSWVRLEFEWAGAEPSWEGGQWSGPSQVWRGPVQLQWRSATDSKDSPRWASVKVRWFANVWTAQQPIGAQASLQPSAFLARELEITGLGEVAIPQTTDLVAILENTRAKRSIPAGAPLQLGAIERLPDARAGQSLRVIFLADSGIQVSTEGSLVGHGRVGEEAKAKLKRSRKIVSGKLVSPNLMEVAL